MGDGRAWARASSLNPRKVARGERDLWRVDPAEWVDGLRPRTRAECEAGPRPCPWVGCRYHLYADVSEETGSMKINFPRADPTEMAVSCALDAAAAGPRTLEEVGALVNLTRERVRQVEEDVLGPRDEPHSHVAGDDGPLVTCGAMMKEDEVRIVEAAARIVEIEDQIKALGSERALLIEKLASLTMVRRPEEEVKGRPVSTPAPLRRPPAAAPPRPVG